MAAFCPAEPDFDARVKTFKIPRAVPNLPGKVQLILALEIFSAKGFSMTSWKK